MRLEQKDGDKSERRPEARGLRWSWVAHGHGKERREYRKTRVGGIGDMTYG